MTNRNQMKGRERPQREDISKYIISFALQMSPSASVEQPCGIVARNAKIFAACTGSFSHFNSANMDARAATRHQQQRRYTLR